MLPTIYEWHNYSAMRQLERSLVFQAIETDNEGMIYVAGRIVD